AGPVSPFQNQGFGTGLPDSSRVIVSRATLPLVWNVQMKALKIAGAVLAALIVVIAVVLTIGIPASLVTSAVQARVERETGYRISIAGTATLGVWPAPSL